MRQNVSSMTPSDYITMPFGSTHGVLYDLSKLYKRGFSFRLIEHSVDIYNFKVPQAPQIFFHINKISLLPY